MGYYINLTNISIDQYREILKKADLLPSRRILKEDIDEFFNILKIQMIRNVADLQKALKNKNRLLNFSRQTGLAEEYLKILIREVNSYHPSPNKLKDFPNLDEEVVKKLESVGIKNTFQLFTRVLTSKNRNELAGETGISEDDILKLTKLTDLSRIRWVNHTFAYMLFEIGYHTVEKVAHADHKELYMMIKQLNEERLIFKGHIGLHDMKLLVDAAKEVPLEIEY